jgi:hypothetical protein
MKEIERYRAAQPRRVDFIHGEPAGAVCLRPDGSLLCIEPSKPITMP